MIDVLLLVGLALILGLVGGRSTERIRSPHVVGFIVTGVVLGNLFPGIFTPETLDSLNLISLLALAFIGFEVGGEMTIRVLRQLGRSIIWIAILEATGAFLIVLAAVYLLTRSLPTALIFGALASATAPAATVDVLREYRSKGPLTSTLFAIVAIDDAIAIILYGVSSSISKVLITNGSLSLLRVLYIPIREIAGSLLLGIILGYFLKYLIYHTHDRKEQLILALSVILIATGGAITLKLSLILVNMALGLSMVNISDGDKKAFEIISSISPPFYITFFVLVGARLRIGLLPELGALGLVYILFRSMGKFGGAYIGARISKAGEKVARYIGLGLLSQAGIAVGLSVQALHEFQPLGGAGAELGLLAVNVIAGTTFVFQIIGPPLTKLAIFKAGEVKPKSYEKPLSMKIKY